MKLLEGILKGDVEQVFSRIALRYIPRYGEVETRKNDIAEELFIKSLILQKLKMDHQGRVVAEYLALLKMSIEQKNVERQMNRKYD